jgi:hypothetical protein
MSAPPAARTVDSTGPAPYTGSGKTRIEDA